MIRLRAHFFNHIAAGINEYETFYADSYEEAVKYAKWRTRDVTFSYGMEWEEELKHADFTLMYMEMKKTEVLGTTPQSKTEIEALANSIANEAIEGSAALELLNKVTRAAELAKQIKEKLIPAALDELFVYGREKPTMQGVTFSKAEAGVTYDFTNCKDQVLDDLIEEEKAIKERIKERKNLLKSIPLNETIVCPQHGNELSRPVKKSTTTIKCTIKK